MRTAWSASIQSLPGIVDQGVSALGAILPVILLGRIAGADDLGLYALAVSAALCLTIVCQTLLLSGYAVFHASDRGSSNVYLFYVLLCGLTLQGLFFPLLVLGFRYFSSLISSEPISHVALAFYVATTVTRVYLHTASVHRGEVRTVLLLNVLHLLVTSILLAWLVAYGSVDVSNVFCVLALANVVFASVWACGYRRSITPRLAGLRPYLARSLAFGRWAFLGVACGSMAYYATPWLLMFVRGLEEVSIYAAATTVVGILNHAFLGLTKGIEARTADAYHEGNAAGLQEATKQISRLALPALSALVVAVILAANFLGGLILPDQALKVAHVAQILSLALLVSSVRVILGTGFWAMGLPRQTVSADFVRGFASVGLGAIGAYYAGALGVAVAVFIGDSASSAIVFRKYRTIVTASG